VTYSKGLIDRGLIYQPKHSRETRLYKQEEPELLAYNHLWIPNNQQSDVVNFHQDFMTTTHNDRPIWA
jgi:hypothetical protein